MNSDYIYPTISIIVFIIGFIFCCYKFAEDYVKDYGIMFPTILMLLMISALWPVAVPIVLVIGFSLYIVKPYLENRAEIIKSKREHGWKMQQERNAKEIAERFK